MSQQLKMVMTPQMQQVIRLLQIPALELEEEVRKELDTNPTLEESDEDEPLPDLPEIGKGEGGQDEEVDAYLRNATEEDGVIDTKASTDRKAEREAQAAEDGEREDAGEAARAEADDAEMDGYLMKEAEDEAEPRERRDRDREEIIEKLQSNQQVEAGTLSDYLMEQLRFTEAPGDELALAEYIIGSLDDNGWLRVPVAEIASARRVKPEAVEAALRLVQTLDPTGVGARDLHECLLLQLRGMEEDTALAQVLVEKHLEKLDHDRPALATEMARATGADRAAVEKALKQVTRCDPRPGGRFTPAAQRIYPDATIEKEGRRYTVKLTDDGVPPLRLSREYREMLAKRDKLDPEERKFLHEKFRSAQLLIKGIAQRKLTITRVIEHLVETQQEFLEVGKAGLKPLTLREVADKIGVHEGTVSRVVSNKYVATPRGVFPLREFFSTSLPSGGGSAVSGAAVRERIRELVEAEDRSDPLSDERLADLLQKEGITIARRTVTKYRESMKISGAVQRRGKSM